MSGTGGQAARQQGRGAVSDPANRVATSLAALWDKFRDGMFRRVDVLDEAAVALLAGRLDEAGRRAAEREAHKLAGSVGTFGFAEASRMGREAELMLEGTRPLGPAEVLRLSELAVAIRRELEHPPGAAPAASPAPAEDAADDRPLMLIVSTDADFAGRVAMEAQGRGLAARVAGAAEDLSEARVLLVDLSGGGREQGMQALRTIIGAELIVIADEGGLEERLRAVRLGAGSFLERPVSPPRAVEAALTLLRPTIHGERHVMALDDDPFILAALRAMLGSQGIRVTALDDPRRFWEVLESERPDLLIVDFEMPHASGAEICRVVRSEARWSTLPVLVLTGRVDADTIERVFAAGADDFVAKPFVGPELLARIESRLERSRFQRLYVETDALTGAANRARSEEAVAQLLRMAARHRERVSVAVTRIDGLEGVNERLGHAAGDEALRRVVRVLRGTLRGEDTLGRWGGQEFVLALYGAEKDDAVQRIAEALERVDEAPLAEGGEPFRLTVSGGVAEAPGDGSDLAALYRAAHGALEQADGRILPAGWSEESPERAGTVDVLVVDDDEALAGLLVHALETRGYRVRWIDDGRAAVEALGGPRPALRARVVLLDVDLPGYDGLSVLRALGRDRVLERTRVVMLTVRAGEREVLDALELGATDHVAKPFSIPVLVQRVRRALREAR